ncbi:MAG: DUF445 domain-containing protein, partial [Gammaproteobacteria bacterium]
MNKSLVTNVLAAAVALLGLVIPDHGDIITMTGLFALSGGVTNWLAVHMLFEKIPGLYGSGVIPARFEDFKGGIRHLIMSEFFTREHIERFLQSSAPPADSIASKVDFDRVFEGLTEAIEGSSMGSMLAMVGGRKALEPLRDPVKEKMDEILADVVSSAATDNDGLVDSLSEQIGHIIDQRLAELTPQHVKTIVEDMIRQH